MGRIEELYAGELYPAEKIDGHGEEFEKLEKAINETWKELREILSEEEYVQVERLGDLMRQSESIRNGENFSYGFKLAIQLIIEGMKPLDG